TSQTPLAGRQTPVMNSHVVGSQQAPLSHCSPGSRSPSPHVPATAMVTEQSACWFCWSVAEKTIVKFPPCTRIGVHEKLLDTGFPLVGSIGVMVAPCGRPATFSVTTSPASTSEAETENEMFC